MHHQHHNRRPNHDKCVDGNLCVLCNLSVGNDASIKGNLLVGGVGKICNLRTQTINPCTGNDININGNLNVIGTVSACPNLITTNITPCSGNTVYFQSEVAAA